MYCKKGDNHGSTDLLEKQFFIHFWLAAHISAETGKEVQPGEVN